MPHLPKSLLTLFGPGTYQPTRAKKSAALQHYLGIVKYLLPDDPSLLASHIWHCDLHSGNIFVNPENPSEVVGITDWQSTEMKPIFDHRIVPYFLDYKGPRIEGFDSAQLPDNFSELDPVEQTRVTSLHLDMALLLLYKKIVQKFNDPLYQALEFQKTTNWSLLSLPRDLLVDGEALYTWLVVQAEQDWPNFPGVRARGNPPFPFQFSPEEVAAIAKDAEDDACGIMYMSHLKESLGDLWPEDRPVEHDQYEVTKMVLADYKQQTIEQLGRNEEEKQAWARAWPFDD
ncbi:hypothetical protein MMC06_006261 [Schaereria dolodes]|nr:hypothetical protein [Schaereria dolodes]